jgi:pimeloyl-ACP methyl ester carboxylesterase
MTIFSGRDGTMLAYHHVGEGRPLICLPGGPMSASTYLGDLGGLSSHCSLVLLDLRGTGDSAVPADQASYRCDRLVDDVEALREHLGLDQIDLLGHSAGANLAVAYAARYPDRIDRLALITPSPRAVDLQITDTDRRLVAELRRTESWFPEAFTAFERIWAHTASSDDWKAITPFTYGRWDAAARAHAAAGNVQRNQDAAGIFGSEGAFDPVRARTALAGLDAPVLVLAGGHDVSLPPRVAAKYAALFPRAELAIQPGGGHYPWLDDPGWFVHTTTAFLDLSPQPPR